ncbi:MAG: PKD domain-containing protein, partial [Methanosarcinaceae archaeon]|nr:PKD domain-containing protein [Methanosarcinaceae archaeon]
SAFYKIPLAFLVVKSPLAPVASFTANVTAGKVPLTVQFNDTSIGTPNSWTWDFGDGTNSTAQNPVHNYETAGNYTVALNVSNACGWNLSFKPDYINVTSTEEADWNPWDKPDSEGGALIITSELQEAVYCWLNKESAPGTGAGISTERLQEVISRWLEG